MQWLFPKWLAAFNFADNNGGGGCTNELGLCVVLTMKALYMI
jgi:hypothetical protein